ncbi:hypothetical protein [Mangrovibacterium marinum]|uniref:Uncharacterized protein n=1 Tax=Mangrovibacterium marinum TaxID=1639118 RepID=A0A2T5BYT1_9BACT|nr:hypothetical protein [Mangrovibacterium marinum]PTN07411.1 hypothetical protein C8N47_1173 [Mangrovibacterium marinum]
MEKPKLIYEYEEEIDLLRNRATEEGREFNFENEVKLSLEKWILSIRAGTPPTPRVRQRRGVSLGVKYGVSVPYDIPQLEYALEYIKFVQKQNAAKSISAPGTARQSALAFYYMQKATAFPRKSGTAKRDAEFINFLSGHNVDTIRKTLGTPLKRSTEKTGKATQELLKDLTTVLKQFELIQFHKGIELVENDIKTVQNDLDSFNPV